MKKKLKIKKSTKRKTRSKSKFSLIISVLVVFFAASLYFAFTSGSGPLSFLAKPTSINRIDEDDCFTGYHWTGKGCVKDTPAKTPTPSTKTPTPSSKTPTPKPSSATPKPTTSSSSCMQKCIDQGTPASTCATVNCYVAPVQPPKSTPTPTPSAAEKLRQKEMCEEKDAQGWTWNGSTCVPPKSTFTPTPSKSPSSSTPSNYNNSGGKTCQGGSAGVNIPDGKWAASGKNMGDGKESQRECVQCQNGVWKGSAACHEQYQKDPTGVILPPQAGNEYTQGVKTKTGSGDTNHDVTYKENCYDSSGIISPTGTGRGTDRCFDGKWVKEADFDAKMKDTCGTKVYNATTNKCEDAVVKPSASPSGSGSAAKCGKYYRWDGKFCVADIANPDRFDEAVTAAKAACVKDPTKQYDMGTGLCIPKTQPLSPVRQFECTPGQHGTSYITCEPGSNGSGASAEYHFCSAKGANGVAQEYVQGVGCRDVGTPVNSNGFYTGGESTKNASDCKYGAKATTNSSGARTGAGFTCLFSDKTSTPPASSSPVSSGSSPGTPSGSAPIDTYASPIVVCKNKADCVSSCGGRYVTTTENNDGKKTDKYYCGDKGDIDNYLKKIASQEGVTYTGTTEIIPPKPTNIDNAGDKCQFTITSGTPKTVKKCSEFCPDFNGDGVGEATSTGGGSYVCNSAPKTPEGKPAPKSLSSGEDCSNGNNDSCESGMCRKGTNPATKESGWFCMTTSNTNTKDIVVDGIVKQKNGAWCNGNNDRCASGFCQINTFTSSGFSFRDVCANNPFVAPSKTSNKNAEEVHIENLQVKYEEIIKEDPDAFKYIEMSMDSCEKTYPGECIPVPGKSGRAVRDQGILDEARRLNISLPETDTSLLNNNSVTTPSIRPSPSASSNSGGGGKPLYAPAQVTTNSVVPSNYDVFMQNGDLGNVSIKNVTFDIPYDTSMNTSGCGPATLVNALNYLDIAPYDTNAENLNDVLKHSDFYVACTGKGCASGADSVLAVLERKYNIPNAYTDMQKNKVVEATDLTNANGVFIYQGDVSDPNVTLRYGNQFGHNAMIVCKNGNCDAIDSYTGEGKPQPCSVVDENNLKCGSSTYSFNTQSNTVGVISGAYLVPGTEDL